MGKRHGGRSTKSGSSIDAILTEIKVARSRNDLPQASSLIAQAEKLFPNSASLKAELGNLLLSAQKPHEAMASFQHALVLDPYLMEGAYGQVKVLMTVGNLAQAEGEREFLARTPNDLHLSLLLSQILTDQDRLTEAIDLLERTVEAHPNAIRAITSLAKRLSEAGDFNKARHYFELAIQLDPINPFAYHGWVQLKRVSEADKGMISAMKDCASSSELDEKGRIQILFALGKVLDDLGDYQAAMSAYREANLLRDSLSSRSQPFDPERYEHLFRLTCEIFTADTIQGVQTRAPEGPAPIFIVGMFRSGTTLVEQILSNHSHVAAGGEIQYWLDTSGACFDQRKRTFDFPRAIAMRKPYLGRLQSVGANKEFVTDKLPGNYRILGLLRILFPKAKFIHCVRHPVDTCLSIYMTAFQQPPNYASDPRKLVLTYRLYQRFLAHWKSVLGPDNIHEVCYEDLVQQPEETTRALLKFCELEFENACLYPEGNARSVSTASVWQARQPIYQSATEKWRRYEPWLGELRELMEP